MAALAFLTALATSVLLLVIPTGTSETWTLTPDGTEGTRTIERTTLLDTEGDWAVFVVAIPAAIAAVALLAGRGRLARAVRLGAAALVSAFAIVTGLSIGLFYLPAALLLFLAAARAAKAG